MSFEDDLAKAWKKDGLPRAKRAASKRFDKAKQFILDEVEKHDICQELRSFTKPSKFLKSDSSTLFGFMGFYDGSDPVTDLLEYLDQNITQKTSVRIAQLVFISSLSIPTKKDMAKEKSLSLDWISGASWPELIERGVPGLRYFLGLDGKGRSDLGLQAKNREGQLQQVRKADMKPVKFLSEIFSRAKKIA